MLSIVFLYKSDDTVVSVVARLEVEATFDAGDGSWTGTAGRLKALRDGVTNGEFETGAGVGIEAGADARDYAFGAAGVGFGTALA